MDRFCWRGRNGDERGALRRRKPFVTVAHVPVRADRIDVEVEHARRMGPVDEERHFPLATERSDRGQREGQGRAGGDVIDDDEARPLRHGRPDRRDDLPGIAHGRGQWRLTRDGARPRRHMTDQVPQGVVDVVRGENFITRREIELAQDGGGSRRRVIDEGQTIGRCPNERGELPRRITQVAGQRVHEEARRIRLHDPAPACLLVEHRLRCRAETAMIEVPDRRIEHPVPAQRGPEKHRLRTRRTGRRLAKSRWRGQGRHLHPPHDGLRLTAVRPPWFV